MSTFERMEKAGLVTGNHESDLYVRDCQQARVILHEEGNSFSVFRDARNGCLSLDVPFAYQPWWDARSSREAR